MATTKTKTDAAVLDRAADPEPAAGRALALADPAGLPAGLLDEMEGGGGEGLSTSADDNIVPFMALLQDMSPEAKKRDDAYIEGAEPGCLVNKATRKLYVIAKEGPHAGLLVDEDGAPLEVQPCAYQRAVVEWVPRDDGGGFVARHDHTEATIEESLRRAGGREVPDPRDKRGTKKIWRTAAGNDLIDTRYHFVEVLHPDGRQEPVVLGFSSTGHTTSREWMSLMTSFRIPGRGIANSWFRKYRVRPVVKKNTQGEWFVLRFVDAGWIGSEDQRAVGRALNRSVSTGAMRAAADERESAGGDAGDGADAPI